VESELLPEDIELLEENSANLAYLASLEGTKLRGIKAGLMSQGYKSDIVEKLEEFIGQLLRDFTPNFKKHGEDYSFYVSYVFKYNLVQ